MWVRQRREEEGHMCGKNKNVLLEYFLNRKIAGLSRQRWVRGGGDMELAANHGDRRVAIIGTSSGTTLPPIAAAEIYYNIPTVFV